MRPSKKRSAIFACVFSLALLASGFALAADDSTVKAGTKQAESGKVAAGVEETARGISHTVSEGAKYSGEKLKEAWTAAEPPAKSAWGNARDAAVGFGRSVKAFFASLFSH
jgi:hypothetical protein